MARIRKATALMQLLPEHTPRQHTTAPKRPAGTSFAAINGKNRMKTASQSIGQSVCALCGLTARPGAGTVLEYGAGGRVHTVECLAVAQNRLASKKSGAADQLPSVKKRGDGVTMEDADVEEQG